MNIRDSSVSMIYAKMYWEINSGWVLVKIENMGTRSLMLVSKGNESE